jgi:hypothetical protein
LAKFFRTEGIFIEQFLIVCKVHVFRLKISVVQKALIFHRTASACQLNCTKKELKNSEPRTRHLHCLSHCAHRVLSASYIQWYIEVTKAAIIYWNICLTWTVFNTTNCLISLNSGCMNSVIINLTKEWRFVSRLKWNVENIKVMDVVIFLPFPYSRCIANLIWLFQFFVVTADRL